MNYEPEGESIGRPRTNDETEQAWTRPRRIEEKMHVI